MVPQLGEPFCFTTPPFGVDCNPRFDQHDAHPHRNGARGASAIPFLVFPFLTWGYLPLLAFFLNLVLTGWAISQFVTGILIRFGLGAESLTWVLPFLIAPFSCIYYPLKTLPDWMQSVATFIPTSYVFEGMRALLIPEGGDGRVFSEQIFSCVHSA